MKVKSDFVTNSSSNCYILIDSSKSGRENEINNLLDELNIMNYFETPTIDTFHNLEQLDEYTNTGPLDWVQEATGPNFWGLDKGTYTFIRKLLQNTPDFYNSVHMVSFDRGDDIENHLEKIPDISVVKKYYW